MKNREVIYTQLAGLLGIILACAMSSISQAATVSDLLITEVMANPNAVSDTEGEWFELFNPTSESIELNGILLMDDGSNSHTISSETSLLVNPGEYFVMARNGDSSTNGGFIADYVYSGFTLGNDDDEIIFSDGINDLLRLNYQGSPEFAPDGISMELINSIMLQDNYIGSTVSYGSGDFGTPGAMGSFNHAASPVPVPGAVWLMGSGLIGLLGFSQRHRS